ncbi:hybrid sensor histidine kinase/response regulator [Marinifilum caeruleilacunae]|uniref:histidine kinase n=1 Tax=Marinifilum caeruleilacunae TaxID=2499076 RepID=A0ABX1X277_9BACT|nr:PAS domain-containing hybrid sensor histidine kinase/response regulator [Marinifilum caeruleilacunae]NOU62195.1 PAS domain-containing hybrid sensor histidine kinase/response regulator [Marinifilum caeruleilacunae]
MTKLKTAIEIRQLKKIHSIAGIGYWVYNYSTKNFWWSEVTHNILGYQPGGVTPSRETLKKHIHPEDLVFFEESLKQMQLQAMEIEFRFYKNGELRLGKITGEVYEKEDIIEEVLFQDITDIKIKEFEIAKAWNKALEAENLKNAFLANMSHELRTPLNSIIGFSELLETGNISENIPRYASSIKDSGLQLLKIIEDLLKVSMLESRTAKPVKRNFNLPNMMLEVKDLTNRLLKNSNKEHLNLNFQSTSSHLVIKSDQNKILGILKNLLHNAIKFTKEGTISCTYQIKNQAIEFSVSDTGKGIPIECQTSVFQRFRQADTNGLNNFGGTGLGLYISRLEIELLGGKIWIASEEKVGTTVKFSIPNVIDHELIRDLDPNPEIYNWENYTVLIAEDQFTNYKILEAYLQPTNVNIIWAKTGREAISASLQNPEINLILMDINMPHTNGLEATKLIKETRPNLTIIAQTAYALEGDREKSLKAGCSEHLSKPFNKTDLLLAMSKYLP